MKITPVVPFEPIRVFEFPQGEPWIAQVKWDGVRMLAYIEHGQVRLINRRGNERSLQYPEFMDPSAYCRADSAILDGEMIAIAGGKPSFQEVMKRDSLRRQQEITFAVQRIPVVYMIFDILYCNGQWVTDQPLVQRQQLLQDYVLPSSLVQLVPNVDDASRLFSVMKERGWEGIVCKQFDSSYAIGGKDDRWRKIKLAYDLYAVIGGVTYRDEMVNAVLLGLYDSQGRLIYIGNAGMGKWKGDDLTRITEEARRLAVPQRPFAEFPGRVKGAVWLKPELTVKLQFAEWTSGGTMRQPVLQGWANVPPEACVLTQQT
ncbi:DNA ligase [Paenibacillus aceti]|uniref:DNA ligase (ATP) n=2 Tax=Paenibacillus aceti TaxID=1820010 RepID=A0ABQ1VWS5_9BACL|nr:RNA ligase family protein [Paenibacillus aceti]GGG02319.1 DNA ligase [Paenibacillus aceti]